MLLATTVKVLRGQQLGIAMIIRMDKDQTWWARYKDKVREAKVGKLVGVVMTAVSLAFEAARGKGEPHVAIDPYHPRFADTVKLYAATSSTLIAG